MKFFVDGVAVEIRTVFCWFDVYINNTMILHHISQEDINSLTESIIKANGKQID